MHLKCIFLPLTPVLCIMMSDLGLLITLGAGFFGWEGEGVVSRDPVGVIRRKPSENLRFHFFTLLSLQRVLALEGELWTAGERKGRGKEGLILMDLEGRVNLDGRTWEART